MFHNFSMTTKILVIVFISNILFSLLIFFYILPNIKNSIFTQKINSVKIPVEIVYNFIDSLNKEAMNNKMTFEEAQSKALKYIKYFRFQNGKNYVWINDINSVFLSHPNPKNIGKDFSNVQDENGVKFISEITRVSQNNGEAFVNYSFPKPDNANVPLAKISYGKFHNGWNWVIASGDWVDDIEIEYSLIKKTVILGYIVIFAVSILFGFALTLVLKKSIKEVKDKIVLLSEGNFNV